MKTLLAIIILITTSTVILVRSYNAPPVIRTGVLMDETDSMQALPQADKIFTLYGLKNDMWNGAEFRFVNLGDVGLTPSNEIKLAPANRWLSNEPERKKEIQRFQDEAIRIMSIEKAIGKKRSSLYFPLATELNLLSQSKADRKIILVFSDLMENSTTISFYNEKTFLQLQTSPDSVKRLLEKIQPIKPLAGVEVYFIYKPADTKQDDTFKVVSEFYRKLLEEKGAHVTISANL